MTDTYDTAELKRLMAEATPGPWFTFANGHCVGGTPTDGSAGGVAMCSMAARTPQEVQANAALVVAAVNALPALLARVEELEAALKVCADELEDELRNRHQPDLHPVSERRFKRDMDTVRDARAALKGGA